MFSYGDYVSHTVKQVIEKGGYDKVIASTSAFGKDIIPRLGGLLDAQPITDVIQIVVCDIMSVLLYFRMEEISS